MRIELSEYNINYDFKDKSHVELLKEQIKQGFELPIEAYSENGVCKVIDGGHAMQAYQELGKEPPNVKVLSFKSDADKIAYSRHKNINRLQQTPVTYTKSLFQELQLRLGASEKETERKLRRWYREKTEPDKYKAREDTRNIDVPIQQVFVNEPITAESFVAHNLSYLDFPVEIAEMVDSGRLSAAQAVLLNGKELAKHPDLQLHLAKFVAGKTVEDTKEAIKALLKYEPVGYNVWIINKPSPVFGNPDYEGKCAGEIVQHFLHYWTEEGDLVVDPMAGGGTTIDVCRLMKRRCLAYDLNQIREDIAKRDVIEEGYHPDTKDCDAIFLDPPYFRMLEGKYSPNDLASLSRKEFIKKMGMIAKASFKQVKQGGVVGLLFSDYVDDPVMMGRRDDKLGNVLCADLRTIFNDAGFEDVVRIQTPLPAGASKAMTDKVEEAKQTKRMVARDRDFYVFRRPIQ